MLSVYGKFGRCAMLAVWLLLSVTGTNISHQNAVDPQQVSERTIKLFEESSQYPNGVLQRSGDPFAVGLSTAVTNMDHCRHRCILSTTRSDADVVFSYMHSVVSNRSHDDQVLVATFFESPTRWSAMSQQFDYSLSYRPDADFSSYGLIPQAMAFMYDHNLDFLRLDERARQAGEGYPLFVPWELKKSVKAMMSVWISCCNSTFNTHRIQLMKNLRTLGVSIASYGKCYHNAHELHPHSTTSKNDPERFRGKYESSSKHLFYYAAENSNCSYYHTEKVYHGLLSGSIPVYVGASTIDDYVPKGSIIKASDFATVGDLANHLKKVATDKNLYSSYFEWQKQNLSIVGPGLRKKLLTRLPMQKAQEQASLCEVCSFFHDHGRNLHFDKAVLGCEMSSTTEKQISLRGDWMY